MALVKPTRKEIIKAATEQAADKLEAQAVTLDEQAREFRQLAQDDVELLRSKLIVEYENQHPIVQEILAVLAKYGQPVVAYSFFGAADGQIHGEDLTNAKTMGGSIYFNYSLPKVAICSPVDQAIVDRIKLAEQRFMDTRAESNRLRAKAQMLRRSDPIPAAINEQLNGSAAAAMEILVAEITKVALGEQE